MKPGKQHFYLILGQIMGLISREDIVKELLKDGYTFEQIEAFGKNVKAMAEQIYKNAGESGG